MQRIGPLSLAVPRKDWVAGVRRPARSKPVVVTRRLQLINFLILLIFIRLYCVNSGHLVSVRGIRCLYVGHNLPRDIMAGLVSLTGVVMLITYPSVGAPVSTLPTPVLVLDLDAMEHNLRSMAQWAGQAGVRLRPHAKTHKCAALAKLQIAAGAVGVCVQKLSEAQALADAGVDDIFISNQIIDPNKLAGVAELARQVRLGIAVDSALGVDRLAEAVRRQGVVIDVFVEVDIGQGRCGVPPDQAGELARQVVRDGLRFAGLQAYQGQAQHVQALGTRKADVVAAAGRAALARASVERAGLSVGLVTGGGTGTCWHDVATGTYREIQPGSYLFMDRDYAANEWDAAAPAFKQALFVKSQVISRSLDHAVVDAGHKAHAIDTGLPAIVGGTLCYHNGGDEHGLLTAIDAAPLPELGDTVWLIPGHCDPTVNLHTHYVAVRGGLDTGVVEAVWPIEARGCLT